MNDKELAEKAVEHGVGWKTGLPGWFGVEPMESGVPAKLFVRDWRVAGALMEKCSGVDAWIVGQNDWQVCAFSNEAISRNESLPRAIIEACVKELDNH